MSRPQDPRLRLRKHTAETYLVELRFNVKSSSGVYVYHHSVNAKRYYSSTTKTKYKAAVLLPHTGKWRVVGACHSRAPCVQGGLERPEVGRDCAGRADVTHDG